MSIPFEDDQICFLTLSARQATSVDVNATALKIFSAARYINYNCKYSTPKGLRHNSNLSHTRLENNIKYIY